MSNKGSQSFVFELGCEELPSSSLPDLNQQFKDLFTEKLQSSLLGYDSLSVIAAPRRLGVFIGNVDQQSQSKPFERKGPAYQAAYQNGEPTKALLGFCRGLGISPDQVSIVDTEKGQWVVYSGVEEGRPADQVLAEICVSAVKDLALSKPMRWGSGRDEFPRPVHWVLSMLGERVLPLSLFELTAGNISYGHRFMAPTAISLNDASEYHQRLEKSFVIADFEQRKELVWKSIQSTATKHEVVVESNESLLTEINCLVEWPVGLCGEFDAEFLNVPEIALIAAMKGHQKYFHTRESCGQLSNKFITVSNIDSKDANQVVSGNQRVIRARLSDAKFFYETDQNQTLDSRRPRLDSITFHPKLGSLGDKTERVKTLCTNIAGALDLNASAASRAAELSRCDLVSEMVLEFDELQGQMGSIYASQAGEPTEVAQAIEGLYQPSGASDSTPNTSLGTVLALADRLDTLAGLFAIDQPPTGSKDPFALRRAAIGVLRLNQNPSIGLDLEPWLRDALQHQPVNDAMDSLEQLKQFILDRERVRLTDQGYRHDLIVAAQAMNQLASSRTERLVEALTTALESEDFNGLVATNKRVVNLLKDCDSNCLEIDTTRFESDAESELVRVIEEVRSEVETCVSRETFDDAISGLLRMIPASNRFFDQVMVNAEDPDIRNNRLAICKHVNDTYRLVADFSLVQH